MNALEHCDAPLELDLKKGMMREFYANTLSIALRREGAVDGAQQEYKDWYGYLKKLIL